MKNVARHIQLVEAKKSLKGVSKDPNGEPKKYDKSA